MVKQHIQDETGFHVEDQRLICGNKTLKNYKRFGNYGIEEGALIQRRIGGSIKYSYKTLVARWWLWKL